MHPPLHTARSPAFCVMSKLMTRPLPITGRPPLGFVALFPIIRYILNHLAHLSPAGYRLPFIIQRTALMLFHCALLWGKITITCCQNSPEASESSIHTCPGRSQAKYLSVTTSCLLWRLALNPSTLNVRYIGLFNAILDTCVRISSFILKTCWKNR